jgi:nicotinamide-nucleotide amidase
MKELKELLLQEPALTVAAAESLTCGHLQALLGKISGSSEYFRGGMTAYTLDQKVRHLGVERAAAEAVNCVSAQVAVQMARGVCRLFKSDLGLATTGYAEPSMKLNVKDPYAWWALAYKPCGKRDFSVSSGRIDLPGATRVRVQELVANAVVEELIRFLRQLRRPSG